jgi:GT2 family glycosyltransferase
VGHEIGASARKFSISKRKSQMKVLVVIANYRVAHLTIDCLRSLAVEIPSVRETQVAVCENGSGDDSAERIERAISDNGWSSWCKLTAISPNLGFTGGNNVILRPALRSSDPPQYVILLNADTIVRPNALKTMVDFMDQNPNVGIAGAGQENPDGTPQQSAFRFHSVLSEFEQSLRLGPVSRLLKRWVVALPIPDQACEVNWVAGAMMIVRREVFQDIGILDEGYYTYFEDVDLCFNARKAGWPVWYVPAGRVMHLAGQSTGVTGKEPKRFPSYFFEARRRYFLKNHGPFYAALADAGLIVGFALWQLRVIFGKPDSTRPYFFRDSIRHSVFLTGFKLRDVKNPALAQQKTVQPNRNPTDAT